MWSIRGVPLPPRCRDTGIGWDSVALNANYERHPAERHSHALEKIIHLGQTELSETRIMKDGHPQSRGISGPWPSKGRSISCASPLPPDPAWQRGCDEDPNNQAWLPQPADPVRLDRIDASSPNVPNFHREISVVSPIHQTFHEECVDVLSQAFC